MRFCELFSKMRFCELFSKKFVFGTLFLKKRKIERPRAPHLSTHIRMPTLSSPIAFRMIRANSLPNDDDHIVIRKDLDQGNFTLRYTDTNAGTNNSIISQITTSMTYDHVVEHMRVCVKSIALDEEGFIKVQIDIPGMPRMLLSVDKLREVYYRDHIVDMVCIGLDSMNTSKSTNMPREPEAPTKKRRFSMEPSTPLYAQSPPISRHLYFDVQGE